MACRTVLLRLHRGGKLQLPEPRHKNRCNSHRAAREVAHDATPVKLPLHELTPIEVSIPPPRSADAALIKFMEAFVDRSRFRGTCYRVANWICVGRTRGRTRNDRAHCIQAAVKDVYVQPLVKDFREALRDDHA